MVPWVGLQCVIVVFPDHTHFLFYNSPLIIKQQTQVKTELSSLQNNQNTVDNRFLEVNGSECFTSNFQKFELKKLTCN